MDAAIDGNYLIYFDWHCVAFTYDGYYVRAWLDGRSETRVGFNLYPFPHGIYEPIPKGRTLPRARFIVLASLEIGSSTGSVA